jgi:hypothetical protein
LAKPITAWQERQRQQQVRLGLQQRLRQQVQQRHQQQERQLEQRLRWQGRQALRLLLFCRKRSKQQRPTKRRTKQIWSW